MNTEASTPTPTPKPTLQLSNVSTYINAELSLHEIELNLNAGEVVAIVGPNGAGKTSLLRAICSEMRLTEGEISFAGEDINQWSLERKAKALAVLPQRSSLEFPFTVSEVVAMGRIPHSSSHQHNQEIVAEALELVDCSQFADRFYINLSGGEKQRVQLARVAAQIWNASETHRCLILDEPSSSLDLAHQEMVLNLIRNFSQQGVAVLTVLHDLNLASKCADRILVLHQGQVVACGPPEEVVTEELLANVFDINAQVTKNPKDDSILVVV